MIIDDIIRDEQNEIWAICGSEHFHLSAEYVAEHKPQIGDLLLMNHPTNKEISQKVEDEPKTKTPE